MSTTKRFRFKKRYILLLLLISLIAVLHSGCFTLRKTPEEFRAALEQKGQSQVEFHTYQQGERKMSYVQVGKGKGRPLVIFIHGSPGSSDAYVDYLAHPELKEKAILISVDRPGFGYSGFGKAELSLEQQAANIRPIIDRIHPSKTILVGHSYGGPVAVRMAADFPDLIDGMVLIAASIDPELEPAIWWRKLLNVPPIRWLVPKALRVCNQEILPLKEELELMMPVWESIQERTVVIHGESDKLVPAGNAGFARRMLVNSPQVEVQMIEDGNHFILWGEIEKITQAILSLLD